MGNQARTSNNILIQAYNELYEGRMVRLTFETQSEFLSFRSMMYAYKKSQDDVLCDFIGHQKKSLEIIQINPGVYDNTYSFQFIDKKKSNISMMVWNEDSKEWISPKIDSEIDDD